MSEKENPRFEIKEYIKARDQIGSSDGTINSNTPGLDSIIGDLFESIIRKRMNKSNVIQEETNKEITILKGKKLVENLRSRNYSGDPNEILDGIMELIKDNKVTWIEIGITEKEMYILEAKGWLRKFRNGTAQKNQSLQMGIDYHVKNGSFTYKEIGTTANEVERLDKKNKAKWGEKQE